MTRVLSISADRSRRGVLVRGTDAFLRQKAYAEKLGSLDIIGFSQRTDPFVEEKDGALHTYPTRSMSRLFYGLSAIFVASKLPWSEIVSTQDAAETGLVGLIISRFLKVPLHVQIHTDIFDPAYARHSLLNRLRRLIARYVLRRASGIRVVSERIKASVEKQIAPKAPISVLPIFVDIEKLRQRKPDSTLTAKFAGFSKRVLFVGRLEKEKHPCLALESFAEVAPADACLIMVGTGSELAHLKGLAEKLGIEKRVFFEGETDGASYFCLADLVLVTSRYEGYGLVIIEALASGVPVLSTDVGIARESGATVVHESQYAEALKKWFADGPRIGELKSYPYANFEEYARAYTASIEACIEPK